MGNKVLTGLESRRVLRSEKTKGKCGYFKLLRIGDQIRWFVWDNRSEGKLRGIRLGSEEGCKKWLL